MSIRAEIGQQVRALRLSRGMTVRELAEASGLGYAHISRIENGKYDVRLDTLEQLCDALGASLEFIDLKASENEVCTTAEHHARMVGAH